MKRFDPIFPFLWLHGEPEPVLREMMAAIAGCGITAVCVESRPHPDFAGPGWWHDMDILLEEARNRDMRVWILDDSHFPTGFANGALQDRPVALRRQSVVCTTVPLAPGPVELETEPYLRPVSPKTQIEQYILQDQREIHDERFVAVTALGPEGERISLDGALQEGLLRWNCPGEGWQAAFCTLSRNMGPHREYINMLDADACRVLLEAVYEPHWAHYAADFGKTIAGFFSDEPEIGNGHLYHFDDPLGCDIDLPWSSELEQELRDAFGADFGTLLPLLWDKNGSSDPDTTARVRYTYMDRVTRLVEKNFSRQVGDWCRAHGVEYIGHLIEDNHHDTRLGSSLGHYFRGLAGQDMAGIDDIGDQVLPQGEDLAKRGPLGQERDGEFYHYALGKLGASLAAIDPGKKGRTMCEIFGAYGWNEGVQLEKYLADHFLVRGVNRFVPHAFSSMAYPDPDCPPHFYAHGHNPQYRHFGALMGYLRRVCGMISGGKAVIPAAILYHAEAEWTGDAMLCQKPARVLYDRQIDFHFLPADVFSDPQRFGTQLDGGLTVNGQTYRVLLLPRADYLPAAVLAAAGRLHRAGFPVFFLEQKPHGVLGGPKSDLEAVADVPVVSLQALPDALEALGLREIRLSPESDRLRVLHYRGDEEFFLLVNEAAEPYCGRVTLPFQGDCCWYDPWSDRYETAEHAPAGAGTEVSLRLDPRQSVCVCLKAAPEGVQEPLWARTDRLEAELPLTCWGRSTCASVDYPAFGAAQPVTLPDRLAEEQPAFSGFVRYETAFTAPAAPGPAVLEITDAAEGVEVFLNGESLGIQIVPTYRYDLTGRLLPGENRLAIEVATTLERENYTEDPPHSFMPVPPPTCGSGLTGEVRIRGIGADQAQQ